MNQNQKNRSKRIGVIRFDPPNASHQRETDRLRLMIWIWWLCARLFISVVLSVCVCVCVCVWERERERVCVCVCVSVRERECESVCVSLLSLQKCEPKVTISFRNTGSESSRPREWAAMFGDVPVPWCSLSAGSIRSVSGAGAGVRQCLCSCSDRWAALLFITLSTDDEEEESRVTQTRLAAQPIRSRIEKVFINNYLFIASCLFIPSQEYFNDEKQVKYIYSQQN